MKPFLYALLFMLLPAGLAHGQQHVYVPGNHEEAINLFRVDIASCANQMLDTLPIGVGSIAFTPDGRLWGVNNNLGNYIRVGTIVYNNTPSYGVVCGYF